MLTYRIHCEATSSIRHLSTAQKNSTMHTLGYVFVYATQSAIYRLKITTSVKPKWKRAWTEQQKNMRRSHSLSLAVVRAHTCTCTRTQSHVWGTRVRRATMVLKVQRERRMWWRFEAKAKIQKSNRTCVYNLWALYYCCCCCCLHTHKSAAYVPALHCSNRSNIFVAP